MVKIEIISTGVPGLDDILGGGLPVGSFNVFGGDPGAGKTTLALQILFSNVTEDRPGLFFTLVGEPPVKMLRYQQQFDFFDVEKVGKSLHFENLTEELLDGGLEAVLDGIVREVERLEPAFVAVDSFSSVTRAVERDPDVGQGGYQYFVQRLSNIMTRWEATTFLLGEFDSQEGLSNPLFTVADGILLLRQVRERDTRVRKMAVAKIRGSNELPGRHSYRISSRGIRVNPRRFKEVSKGLHQDRSERVSTGVAGLDEMTSGGFVRGDATILSGPSGSGKSVLSMQFAGAGLDAGEPVVIATFEESRKRYVDRAAVLGLDFDRSTDDGRLRLLHRRPLDLSVDETFEEIRNMVEEIGAARVVIDSLSGLQVAASGTEAERLRESMGRMVQTLTEGRVTVLLTAELNQRTDMLRFTPHNSSFLADNIILQRYIEFQGQLRTAISVVKMRRSSHSRAFRRYQIEASGLVIGDRLDNFHGILTGVPRMRGEEPRGGSTGGFDGGGTGQGVDSTSRGEG